MIMNSETFSVLSLSLIYLTLRSESYTTLLGGSANPYINNFAILDKYYTLLFYKQ